LPEGRKGEASELRRYRWESTVRGLGLSRCGGLELSGEDIGVDKRMIVRLIRAT